MIRALIFKRKLVEAARKCYNSGLQTGTGGNFSARLETDAMLVKTSGNSFGDCTLKGIIVTDFSGNILKGKGKPSREVKLHGYLYKSLPGINSIIHCHSPWAISWSLTKKDLPMDTKHFMLKIGEPLKNFNIAEPVVPESKFEEIGKYIAEHEINGFLLAGHGVVAFGKNTDEALYLLELIEETAKVCILNRLIKGGEV